MHSPHVNLHRPFGDVSGLERHGSAEDEVPCVSHCGQQTFLGHNESTLTQHNLCGSSRAVVNNSDCHSGSGKGKTTSLVLHPVRDTTPYSGGTTGGNPAHGFQIYDNTSFQAKGSIPYNIEPSCLAYTETASTYSLGPATRHPVHVFQTYENMLFQTRGSNLPNIQGTYLPYSDCRHSHQLERTMHLLASKGHPCKRKADMPVQGIMLQEKRGRGGHTEQQQRNVGGGEGNSHYANEMCYLYSDDASFDLESPVATHETSDAQGMYYSPMPLPMNEHLSHSRNAQENDQGAATSSSMLQPEMPDPAIVTNVVDSSAYRGEDQHLRFQTGAGRPQQNSRRRTSNHASTTIVNGEGLTPAYIDIGDANWRCHWCGAAFWFGERLKSSRGSRIRYGRCCGEGKVRLQQERDPPDSIKQLFKDKHFMENIRAYNQMFNGARQYEVPSTDILGAIVFESGPETNTEYHVIIQKKGERPQRINKLHSTYMALQFPLLFVYGQPGCKQSSTSFESTANFNFWKLGVRLKALIDVVGGVAIVKTRDLEDKVRQKRVQLGFGNAIRDGVSTCHAKLYPRPQTRGHRKNTRAKGLPYYIGCYITSGEAGNIGNPTTNQSRIKKVEIQNLKYKALYEEKEPLCVTRYRLNDIEQEQQKNRIPFQQLFKHKAATYKGVRFTCQATITRLNTSRGWYYTSCCVCINKVTHEDGNYKCKTHGFIPAPNYRYNFRATLTDGTGSATFIFFTPKADEFIGVNYGDLVASHKGLQRGQFPKEIEAIVGTNHTFQFHYNTTSNPGVTEFVMDEVFGITDKPKQIDSNPSDYIGCYITSGEAENIGNPTTNQSRIRKVEIQNLKYKALYEEKEPICVTRYRLNDIEQEQQKNRIPFQQLFKHKAATYKGVRFTCQATITRLNTSRGWYYTSCCVCINKVTHEDGNYKCKTHGFIPAPNYRYNFRATLTDGTGSATFIFFTPKADEFIGVNCGDLVASHKGLQRGQFPKEIEAIVGTNHTFQFHYNTTSNPGVTEFVMDEVFGITEKPKQIDSNPSGLDSLPKALPTPTPELKAPQVCLKLKLFKQKGTPQSFKKKDKHQPNRNNTLYPKHKPNKAPQFCLKSKLFKLKGTPQCLKKKKRYQPNRNNTLYPNTQTKQGQPLSTLKKTILSILLKQISIFYAETTPPEAASVAMQTRSKTEMEPNVAPKTVKRRIFTEEPSESKKKKELEHTQHLPSFAT
ncbi:hypothetical protein CTI12_AA079770 [Artemisia annua]|uniref:Replication factor A C-terminal domain-containing protein n=1 Tax=Artemisia annua TaxID=35608 RepID=A0A2U1Q2R8_ARTAN|nr:hypothetical protein CTI12_AA079770 [Artemisia annua]